VSKHRNLKNAASPLDLVHADLMGPLEESLAGSKYILVVVDDYSRYSEVACLGSKAEATDSLCRILGGWSTRLDRSAVLLRTDNGRELCNHTVKSYCANRGIHHQTTVPYTPQSNGRVERLNRTLMKSHGLCCLHAVRMSRLGKKLP
jgi:transposase InsO family protein